MMQSNEQNAAAHKHIRGLEHSASSSSVRTTMYQNATSGNYDPISAISSSKINNNMPPLPIPPPRRKKLPSEVSKFELDTR